MTTSMIFWSIVFLLALIGLVWLFARDAKRAPTSHGHRPPYRNPSAPEPFVADYNHFAIAKPAGEASILEGGPGLAYELRSDGKLTIRGTKTSKPEYRYRSAITGKFVKASYAKRYPHRTVRSKVKP